MSQTEVVSAPAAATLSLEQQLVGSARYVQALRRGPRAVLRRLDAGGGAVPPQEFWNVAERYQIRPADEEFWLHLLPLMVRHPHEPGLTPGAALARARVSGARVERWLRLDRAGALAEAGRLLSHLKDSGLDWARFGRLLRYWSDDLRRELARQFFRSPEFRQHTATSTDGAD